MKESLRSGVSKYLDILRRNRASRFPVSIYGKINDTLFGSKSRFISRLYLQSRRFSQKTRGVGFDFVSLIELFEWTDDWVKSFPTNYDVVIGIPRSGLLVAGIIAAKLGKPLTTPELFLENHLWQHGNAPHDKDGIRKVLLVDDTACSGKTLERNLQLLHSSQENLDITKAVLIVTEGSKNKVDLHYKTVPKIGVYEWNFLDSKEGKLASDLDGVICENCPPGVDSNEELYTAWIRNAKPYLIPNFEIDLIVSARLEKYRSETEKWLGRYGVRYKELILWNLNSKRERNGKNAQHKIDVYLERKPNVIWESSCYEAKQIWESTKIPTLCVDDMILLS